MKYILVLTLCCCLVTKSFPTLVTSHTVAHQASLSMEFSLARMLEWVIISFSRGSSQLKD